MGEDRAESAGSRGRRGEIGWRDIQEAGWEVIVTDGLQTEGEKGPG